MWRLPSTMSVGSSFEREGMRMIYAVIAAVLGFAGWQLYKFVRRINRGGCASGCCEGCEVSQTCASSKASLR